MAKPLFSFSSKFLESLERLPREVHSRLVKCLTLFSRDPQHSGLNVERLGGSAEGLYSARVNLQYRLVFAQPSQEDVRLLFVGTHDDAYKYAKTDDSQAYKGVRAANTPVEPDDLETFLQLSSIRTKKYLPLCKHLMSQPESVSRFDMTFQEVEEVIGYSLPASARKHLAWWSNDRTRHVQASAWLGVGWKTQGVRLAQERVSFVRAAKTVAAVHG